MCVKGGEGIREMEVEIGDRLVVKEGDGDADVVVGGHKAA